MHKYLFIIVLCLFTTFAYSQDVQKLINKGKLQMESLNYSAAISTFKDILLIDNSLEAKAKLAECFQNNGDYEKAIYWYQQLVTLNPNEPKYKLKYAQLLQSTGKCEEAKKWFMAYNTFDILGEHLAKGCDQIALFMKDINKYSIINLPVNTPASDFGAVPYQNGIAFCSDRNNNTPTAKRGETMVDIYYAEKQLGNAFTPAQKLKGKINSNANDGTLIFENDTQCIVTKNAFANGKLIRNEKGNINLQLYSAKRLADGKWDLITPLFPNNLNISMAHPTISPDGESLFFVSDMEGSIGGLDIFVCSKIDTFWSMPLNLGNLVNSTADELFPFYAANNKLYFATTGQPGLGGLDVFYTERINGKWSIPTNAGAPINSTKDDFALYLNPDALSGYISSNREGSLGSDDIYYFENIELAASQTPEIIKAPTQFDPSAHLDTSLFRNLIGMNKLQFAPGSWVITDKDKTELDRLALFLNTYEHAKISIISHTDSRGDDFNNQEISEKRANNIRDYLLEKNIALNRISAEGKGETELLNHCKNGIQCNNELHNINNRVQILITKFNQKTIIPPVNVQPTIAITTPEPTITSPNAEYPFPTYNATDSLNQTTSNTVVPSFTNPETIPNTEEQAFIPSAIYSFKVYIGPFKSVDNDTYYTYKELNTPIDLAYTPKGMMIALGPYETITEAEEYEQFAKQRGAKKTKLVVFNGNIETNTNYKTLKKSGVK